MSSLFLLELTGKSVQKPLWICGCDQPCPIYWTYLVWCNLL